MEQWERKILEEVTRWRQEHRLWGPTVSWGHVTYRGNKRPAVSDGIDVIYLQKSGLHYVATEHVMRTYRPHVVCRPYKPREDDQ